MQRIALASLVLLASVVPGRTMAHEVRPAYLQINEQARDRFDVLWKQPGRGELVLNVAPTLSNGLLDTAPDEQYSSGSFVIQRWVGRELARESFDGATLRIEGLERTLTDALVSVSFADGQQIQTLLKPDAPALTIHLTGTGKLAVPAYLTLGIEHILTGYDHLAFVLGLVLLMRGILRVVTTVTAFTLAHSITLALAALGYVHVSPPIIESLVALSIVLVAVEVIRSWRGQGGLATRHPWLIAFAFGLLHGLAFAGFLADVGLPAHDIPAALVLFNCGVEIGQVIFVCAVMTLIWILRRSPWMRWGPVVRVAVCYGIGTLAAYWMFERIVALASAAA